MNDDPRLDRLANLYLEHLVAERRPKNTIAAARRSLASLGGIVMERYIADGYRRIDIPWGAGAAQREDVEAWWESRADLAPATRAADLANLRSFYHWCARWEYRIDDPTARLDAPKVPNGLPRPISRPDLEILLAVLPPDLKRAVCLGAWAGLRISESAALDWSDVDLEARRIRVVESKGAKSRYVAVSQMLLDSLLPATGGNVVTAGDAPYTGQTLQRRLNRAIKAAGVDATTHQLRHRYGTMAYQATGDVIAVGRMMGHSSPVTTAVYAQANDDVAAKIANAVTR